MDNDEPTLRDRLLDRYDSVVEGCKERTQGFEFSNLTDGRNLWALVIGSLFLAGIPTALLQIYAGLPEAAAAVIFWPAWIVAFAFGALAIGTVGVARCRQCGKRLKAGYYICRHCGTTSKPKGVR